MADFNQRAIKSPAVLAAEQRRIDRASIDAARTEMFVEKCVTAVNLTVQKRVALATEFLRSRIVLNISRPVTKTLVSRREKFVDDEGKTRSKMVHRVLVSDRSVSGEFPKADTTTLMKSIFTEVQVKGNVTDGFVGTPLDYGLELELHMQRSFLLRTFNEIRPTLIRMLVGTDQVEQIK